MRASGVRLRQLRLIALLESGVPLVFTALAGLGTALLTMAVVGGDEEFRLPGVGLFVAVGLALLVALGVSLITWPLMDAATRHDNVRFE